MYDMLGQYLPENISQNLESDYVIEITCMYTTQHCSQVSTCWQYL